MILEPWKSAEEIDRRLAALNDPELAELLRNANRELLGDDETQSYTSPSAPYWKKRIAFVALAGLFALSAGFSASIATRPHSAPKVHPLFAVPALAQHRAVRRVHRVAAKHSAPKHAPAPVHRAAGATVAAAAPDEALVRRVRAQMLHEQAVAAAAEAQARAEAARAHHEAQIAAQAQAQANAKALHDAIAQARAQARAEAIAQARADALAREQAQQLEQAQQQALLDNARDPNTKPGYGVPPGAGHMDTNPMPNAPAPAPGPIDPNCTPHRGSLFTSALDHVRLGPTNVGTVLRLIHP
jgi:hypothetical protein